MDLALHYFEVLLCRSLRLIECHIFTIFRFKIYSVYHLLILFGVILLYRSPLRGENRLALFSLRKYTAACEHLLGEVRSQFISKELRRSKCLIFTLIF